MTLIDWPCNDTIYSDSGELTWISAVVIAVLILLIAIVMIMWFCQRIGGEVYDVKKAEFICGNDPEKERLENKPLIPYCGLTNPSLLQGIDTMNKRSLEDAMESQDVDATTDSSVQYDDDIANHFDDQGSFIDAYKGPPKRLNLQRPFQQRL
ncbi:hypothetical protein Ciccas_005721 [Cichlidogyrus casuarinus]|uniref:Neurofascin/L1/NrCAM C-terminal domain-containing protein n=1 Tax=Cichlidogyrus casuarinus TaxID=1844966 RepID=A0ABD2Q846_9PLAT